MVTETRSCSYDRRLLAAGISDLMEQLGGEYSKCSLTGEFSCRFEFCNNVSGLTARFIEGQGGTTVTVTLTEPAPGLTLEGQRRVAHFFLDGVEQLIENELLRRK